MNFALFRDAPKGRMDVPARTHAQAALYTRKVWAVVVERIKWAESEERSPLFLPMKLASHPTITALAGGGNQQTPSALVVKWETNQIQHTKSLVQIGLFFSLSGSLFTELSCRLG